MRFGVVTPTLDAGTYLEATLDSIWGQRGDGIQIHHVLVDGGSTDDTLEIASRYPTNVLRSTDDRGMYDAVNRGMAVLDADVVTYINGDDLIAAGALRRVAALFEGRADADWVVGAIEYIDQRGERVATLRPVLPSSLAFAGLGWCSLPQQSMWVRRSFFDRVGDFDISFRNVGDYEWITRALTMSAPVIERAILGKFRVHDAMLSADVSKMHRESRLVQERYRGRTLRGWTSGRALSLRLNASNPSWLIAKKTGRLRLGA